MDKTSYRQELTQQNYISIISGSGTNNFILEYNEERPVDDIPENLNSIDPSILKIPEQNILWNEAFAEFHIADSKGLNEELNLKWNGKALAFSPSAIASGSSAKALTSPLNITSSAELANARFTGDINLNGSERLLFTPVGKSSTVQVNSSWKHPSFTGNILPQTSEINDSGFTAKWTSLSHTRNFPQQWLEGAYRLDHLAGMDDINGASNVSSSSFGMELFVPVNGYQKTMRSVKYAILCILLTFTAFFLIETTNRKSVHPVQYALIGFALILFYTLLLSFSEYIGFNQAYGIAAIATIGLITWFVKGLLGSMKLSMLLSFILILMYSYVFTILQLQDYALILGSIGLFLTLAVVMFFSRKIQW